MPKVVAILLPLSLSLSLAACLDDPTASTDEQTSTAESASSWCQLPPLPADSEYVYYRHQPLVMSFPGYYSANAETFFIWNLGTSIQHGAPYPDPSHGRLYGVFAPGPAGSTHHVDGQDQWDHYHIVSKGVGIDTFDVRLVFPGPNFNAATWHAPTSEEDMNAAIAAGLLGAPLLTTDAGFGPLVFKVPVSPLYH